MGCANGKAYGSVIDDPHAKDPAVTDDWECKAEALRLFNLVRALRICPCHSCLCLSVLRQYFGYCWTFYLPLPIAPSTCPRFV